MAVASHEGGGTMDLVMTLVTGGLIGWLASLLMKTDGHMGVLANILIGIVGSVLGTWLAGVLGSAVAGSPARGLDGRLGPVLVIPRLQPLGRLRTGRGEGLPALVVLPRPELPLVARAGLP